jgi:hypothetical protein
VRSDVGHVSVALDSGPVLLQYAVAEVVYLDLPRRWAEARSFQPPFEASDT